MLLYHVLLASIIVCSFTLDDSKKPLTDDEVRDFLIEDDPSYDGIAERVIALGERAFPIFQRILSAKKVTKREITGVLSFLSRAKGDRSQFLELAVAALADPDNSLRGAAIGLIEKIGSSTEAAPIVALLSDKYSSNAYAAARALAVIGDRRTLVAMDAWLNTSKALDTGHAQGDAVLRKYVTQHRDELKKRLEQAKPPGK